MSPRLVRALWLFLAAQTFILASGYIMFAIIGKVNRRTPAEERVSYLFGHIAKYSRLLRAY
jgi:hypothetical protein